MTPANELPGAGVGPTAELSLRVSVATLARIVFPGPADAELMLALEHKATLRSAGGELGVLTKAQPFGGAVRILNLDRLQGVVGSFHFDSERSRAERDLRILIRPSDWETVREFCLRNLGRTDDPDLETDPARELAEEFEETLGIEPRRDQFAVKPVGIVLENEPAPTWNLHAMGVPTVRIYRVFEVQVVDPELCRVMVANSAHHPAQVLRSLALEDARRGGRGRANALLVAPIQRICDAYLALAPEMRGEPLSFENSYLDGNVAAILEGIAVPKYRNTGPG